MSYSIGISESMRELGFEPNTPHIICDMCGISRHIGRGKHMLLPAMWFVDGKPAPKWSGNIETSTKRTDYCPECTAKIKQEMKR